MFKILLVEDHKLVRNGLRLILDSHDEITVIGESDNGVQALEFLNNCELPDLIVTDINMPEMDGISLISKVRFQFPEVRIAVLSMIDENTTVLEAFRAGAAGYLSKNADYNELLGGVLQVAGGGRYLSNSIGLGLLDNFHVIEPAHIEKELICQRYDISERELSVLELIAQGFTNAEIADKIFLSKRTIEGHRQQLIDKTKTKNTADLVRFAFQNKLLV
ncbi:DNA-binding response regulator [Chryseobacterium indologenes]|jgi:DNA-binding NarL/FixJ family response regulator|uniref:response regulator transcription factor n=1 Tax=Chryseobacterium indologenes TaxID=253 RepID=UPI000F4F5326|nr:response regulator transcription factor [Chryseobacterium indologenes]AYZ36119.1 DNA-binding response regulator [Chryseobacterium indologenes]MEB4760748.1 response regulator transcription factor [Chryseobacterium indologenes]